MEVLEETSDPFLFTDTAFRSAYNTSFSIIVVIYLLSISVMFPFYVYVYRSNRERDEGVSVFPITNHFYNVVVFMQIFLYLALVSYIVSISLISPAGLTHNLIIILIAISGYFVYGIITMVLNFLLFFLALQRFLIYTYPKCDRYISPKKSTFKRIMVYVYLVMVVLHCSLRIRKVTCWWNGSSGTEYEDCTGQYDEIYMYLYLFSDFLVIVSSIFYVIMIFKIRQITKMASTLRSKPEKFIMLQTALIIVLKIVIVPFVMLGDFDIQSLDEVFFACLAIDIATTSFVIQVSYLVCNKNNLDTLLSIRLEKTKTWLILCCCAHPSIATTDPFDLTSIPNQQKK